MRQALLTGIGFFYGLVLAFFGLGVAGGGHGAMIPLYIFGSPFFFPLLFLAPIVLWMIAGFLLGRVQTRVFRLMLFCLLALHYLGIAPYLVLLGDWDYLSKAWEGAPISLTILFAWYVMGQVALWIAITKVTTNPRRTEVAL